MVSPSQTVNDTFQGKSPPTSSLTSRTPSSQKALGTPIEPRECEMPESAKCRAPSKDRSFPN